MTEENMTKETIPSQAQQNEEMLRKIYTSVEKTRKMFLWTLILTVLMFVLPLIGLAFAIPAFINTYVSALGDSDTLLENQDILQLN